MDDAWPTDARGYCVSAKSRPRAQTIDAFCVPNVALHSSQVHHRLLRIVSAVICIRI